MFPKWPTQINWGFQNRQFSIFFPKMLGRKFDDYPGFQPKTAPAQRYATQCMSLLWKLSLELTSKAHFILVSVVFNLAVSLFRKLSFGLCV